MLLSFLTRHRTAFAIKKKQSYMLTVPRLRKPVLEGELEQRAKAELGMMGCQGELQ